MMNLNYSFVPFIIVLGLGGCASLPSAGPKAADLSGAGDIRLVDVTPSYAEAARARVRSSEEARLLASLSRLPPTQAPTRTKFEAGDTLHVDLLTISPWSGGTNSGGMNMTPSQINLGEYTVGPGGTITLPYAGRVSVAGLDVPQVQSMLSGRFASLGIMQNPAIKVDADSVPQGSVIVTGAVGSPKTIQWSPAGMTLAQALTMSLGNGTDLLTSNRSHGESRSATEVSIFRGDAKPVRLPMSAALEHVIPLERGDRIVVTRSPAVKVAVLGAGVSKDGEYDYAQPPTLAEVLAQASGLNDSVADDHAVFVLSQGHAGAKPTVYNFAWNKVDGLVASQDFPIENNEVVYVAEAPIIPVQRAVSLLFQLALPAQVFK
jgi:polysaccharide export outer membrane protein